MKTPPSVSLAPHLSFLYRIGQCPACMRQSFLAAAGSLGLFVAAMVATPVLATPGWALIALAVLAVAMVALWLTHIVVFALRALSAPPVVDNGTGAESAETRRAAIGLFLRAIAGAAAATALPSVAWAFNECPGQLTCPMTSCNPNGTWCCPPGYPILNLCNCRCYQTALGVRNAGCISTASCYNENF